MVSVPGRPSFVYVRVHGNNSEVIEAFNDTVSPILNLAVVLTRDELTPNYYRILRRDVAKYQDWYTPQIGYHATQHEFGGTGSMGADIVWIQKQQFTPLEVRPISTSGSSYQCFVDPEYYQWNAGYQFFSGGATPDLNFLRPGGQLQGLFLGVYMDGNTDALAYITGTQFTHTPWPDNFRSLIPTVPTSVGIPLAGILLTHEMSGINWSQIYDTRAILGNGGMTGSAASLPDAPSDGSIYGRKNATWTAVTGTGGGGIPDAPSDGSLYGRKNAGWTVVTGTGGGGGAYLALDQSPPQTVVSGSPVFAAGLRSTYIDKLALAVAPSTPAPNTLRLYVETEPNSLFEVYKYKDDLGMVRELVRDSVFIVEAGDDNIPIMAAVYAMGSDNQMPLVGYAQANSLTTMPCVGLMIANMTATGDFGRVMMVGLLENVDTSAFVEGDVLYISPTVPGGLTATKPSPPNLVQEMGTVLVSSPTVGKIQVISRSVNATELDPLSLHLDQTAPQTFTNLAGGTGLMKVTTGVLGLDTKQYVTGSPWTGMGYVTGTPWTGMGYITGSPGGDMLKSVYDPNNDGIIGIVQGGTNATGTAQARTNLGLGNSATRDVGTTSGTVAAGDDARFGATGTSSGGGCVARGWVLEPPILVLDTLTKSVRAKLGAAQTSAPVQFSAHFADSSSSGAALSEGSTFIDSTGTASVELVAHPTGSPLPRRDVVFVSAVNNDTIVQTVIIYLDDGGTEYDIFRTVIPAGQSWNSTETATVSGSATPGDMLKSVYDPDVNGIIAIAQGGTNASTAPAARTNLGLGAAALYGVGLTTGTVAPGNTKLDAWSAPDDNTNLNVSSSAHGLAPKGTTGTTQYWRQDWTLGVPVRTLHIPLRLADNTTAFVTGTTAGGDWRLPTVTGTIVDCGAWTDTAGVTGTAVIDIHKNGTTIMTTNKISIASGQKSSEDGGATQPTITAGGYAPNDILTVDKDAAHGFPALGLVVWVDLRES